MKYSDCKTVWELSYFVDWMNSRLTRGPARKYTNDPGDGTAIDTGEGILDQFRNLEFDENDSSKIFYLDRTQQFESWRGPSRIEIKVESIGVHRSGWLI